MIAWLVALGTAHAGAFYHPADVSAASARFAEAQQTAGTAFQARQERSDALAAALVHYETAIDLLGDRDVAAHRTRHTTLRTAFGRQQAVLRATASDFLDAFDAAFSDALARALDGRDAEVCQPDAGGLRMGPRFARGERTTCEGDDLNAELATAIDADPALGRDLEALLAMAWPAFDLPTEAVAAVGDGAATLDPLGTLQTSDSARAALTAIDRADDDARLPLQAAIEEGITEADVPTLKAQAASITAATAASRAALASPVLDTIEATAAKLDKKGAAPTVAWCPQPEIFGGCTPEPVDADCTETILTHPKVAKALDRAGG